MCESPVAFPPPEPAALLEGRKHEDRDFRENIRSYNNALAFVSFGADLAVPPGPGPPVYRIHGAVYHASGALRPSVETAPAYSQLYVWDGAEALDMRMQRNPHANRRIMQSLVHMNCVWQCSFLFAEWSWQFMGAPG